MCPCVPEVETDITKYREFSRLRLYHFTILNSFHQVSILPKRKDYKKRKKISEFYQVLNFLSRKRSICFWLINRGKKITSTTYLKGKRLSRSICQMDVMSTLSTAKKCRVSIEGPIDRDGSS